MSSIEFTVAAKTDVSAFYTRIHKRRITPTQLDAYLENVREALAEFEKRFEVVPYIANNRIHTFTALSSSGLGSRFPKHVLTLTFERRGAKKYIIHSPVEMPLPRGYAKERLIEEAKYIETKMPDLGA